MRIKMEYITADKDRYELVFQKVVDEITLQPIY